MLKVLSLHYDRSNLLKGSGDKRFECRPMFEVINLRVLLNPFDHIVLCVGEICEEYQ